MEKYELAYEDYKQGMKYKDIATKYDVSINTVKSWKSRKWNDTPKVAHNKKGCTQKEKVAHKKEIPKAIEQLNDNEELTDKQKMFCLYYLQSFNATQSYMKVYKCTYNTAMVEGNKMLRKPYIKEELNRIKLELQTEQFFNIDDIMKEYGKQAFADINDLVEFGVEEVPLFHKDGSPAIDEKTGEQEVHKQSYVRFKNQSEVDGTLIQEVRQGKDGVSLKTYDKQKAMDALIKLMPEKDKGRNNITIVDNWGGSDE